MKPIQKKLLLLSFFLLAGVSVFAQVRLGVKAGLNLADMKYEPKDKFFRWLPLWEINLPF